MFPPFDDFEREILYDDLEDSETIEDIDHAIDEYDDRKAQEMMDRLETEEYEEGYQKAYDEFANTVKDPTKKVHVGILSDIAGTMLPADQLAVALGFAEELSDKQDYVKEPISGKEQKVLMQQKFSKVKKNLPPFETYVTSLINGEEQAYLKEIKTALDSLYYDIFGAGTDDFYIYLLKSEFITRHPSKIEFKHLMALKNIADVAMETHEFGFLALIKKLIKDKKFDFNKELT